MPTRGLVVACALGALILPAQAQVSPEAQPFRTVMVGNWEVGAFLKDGTRNLAYCAARTGHQSGVGTLFLLDRNYRWGLALHNSAWQIAVGSRHDLTLAIDGGIPRRVVATAVSANRLVMGLADSVELFAEFRRGRVLHVSTPYQSISVSLEGTSAVLPRLLACVRDEVDAAASGAPVRGGNRAALITEATVILANLLGAAGVQGFQMGSAEAAAKQGGDAIWASGEMIGVIRVLENARVDDPDIAGAAIGHGAKNCKGAFLSGSLPEAENEDRKSLRIFTTCEHNLTTTTVYYFGVPRPKGGIYLFATMSTGSPERVKETDSGLRTAVYRLVK